MKWILQTTEIKWNKTKMAAVEWSARRKASIETKTTSNWPGSV